MSENFRTRSDIHIAPGQESTGLSYDPDRPIEDQLKEDKRFLKATEKLAEIDKKTESENDSELTIDRE